MENNSDSVLEMYLYETNTLLEQLDNIMLSAEQADTLSEDDVNEIFRIMHTLKGSAAMMEFEPLMTIAHRIDDLFYLIREKRWRLFRNRIGRSCLTYCSSRLITSAMK